MSVSIRVKRLDGFDAEIPLPFYETAGAAGADIRANFAEDHDIPRSIKPGERTLISTGLSFEIPQGFEVQIRPRSGLALKKGITLVNTPGTIDADYRGPVGIIVINHGHETVEIAHGERIAQCVVAPVLQADFVLADTLSFSERGDGGFGSTGSG